MPTIFRHNGFRFFFYSNEGDPREPVHVHVILGNREAKLWMHPTVVIARSNGFDSKTQRRIVEIAQSRAQEIEDAWHDHFRD